MCLVALLWRVSVDAHAVLGANREEFYVRGGLPPRRLEGVSAVGGVDPVHGGTWLGINARGVLVAVTNRRRSEPPVKPASRGLLVRTLLGLDSAAAAADRGARTLSEGRYDGCNLLCVDARDALVVHSGDWLRVHPLPPGIHVLANRDINDPIDARVCHAAGWLAEQPLKRSADALDALRRLCGSHEPATAPVCFHQATRGTVSSSLVALRPPREASTYLHAQGPPDATPYAEVSHLLAGLRANPQGE